MTNEKGPNLCRFFTGPFASVDAFEATEIVQDMADMLNNYTGNIVSMEIMLTENTKTGVIVLKFANVADKEAYKKWSKNNYPQVIAVFANADKLPAEWSGRLIEYIEYI
jgi:uncharacterized protein with ACT and thioredoxin-like domain